MLVQILLSFGVAAGVIVWLTASRFGRGRFWAAMVSPLASIIGSGFLVSAPLLAREFGSYAIFAMGLLLATAWAFGAAVRHNIAHVEGRTDLGAPLRMLERLADAALAVAYVVSVGYYLALLGSFVTKLALGAPDREMGRWIATGLIVLIAWLGWTGGLMRVIRVEAHVVAFKLAVIAGFLAALGLYAVGLAWQGEPEALVPLEGRLAPSALPVLFGLLITVQGFETSRYLGAEFDAATRIRTMRRAQLVAGAIYMVFFLLMLPLLPTTLTGAGETAIIDAAAAVAVFLPVMLTMGAVASQFSAAVADAIGGAGLGAELGGGRVAPAHVFPPFGALAIGVLWSTDVFGIIALASRAFALYYMLQCLIAGAEIHRRRGLAPRAVVFFALAALAAAIVVFGVPAE